MSNWNNEAEAREEILKLVEQYYHDFNPIDGHPPGSAIPGILQARTLEWVAISFSNA